MIDLYVVESPLQALSAAEAKAGNGKKVDTILLVRRAGEKRLVSDEHMTKAVSFGKWENVVWLDFSKHRGLIYHLVVLWHLLKLKNRYLGKIRNLYIGEFRAEWMLYLRSATRPLKTYLLDDGAVTITIQNQYLSKGIYWPDDPADSALKGIIRRVLYFPVYTKRAAQMPINLFTSFELSPGQGQEVVRHSFAFMRESSKPYISGHEVYYFGAKYSEAGVMTLDHEMAFLDGVSKYYKNAGFQMTYIPHRDDSDAKLRIISDSLGLPIKRMACPAELYFAVADHRPCRVSAAYSSVLNNLRLLLGHEVCDSFVIPASMIGETFIDNINEVYEYYRNIGLNVINMENL